MRETNFIKQNREKWSELEALLRSEKKDPKKLNDLFIQVTDDLSYSRTFYPNRSVRVYLNGLAQRIFYSIYKNRRNRRGRFLKFWLEELPLLVYEARFAFLLSFLVFTLAMAIGVVSSIYDPDFCRVILGEDYVDMTLANIKDGDPMAVYKAKGKFSMSLGITLNNIFVALRTFVMGILFTLGTIASLLVNGIMVGTFQYFFYEQGLLAESALTIWMHGTLEISAIIIAGAAGITMGRGLVFPGTLSRGQSFQISARRGLKIAIGLVPIFIIAGTIEGFVTRMTELPDIVRLLFILACLAFVLGYFVIYPLIIGKFKNRKMDSGIEELQPNSRYKLDVSSIKTVGQLFTDIFAMIRLGGKKILGISALGSLLFCVLALVLGTGRPTEIFTANPQFNGVFQASGQFFYNDGIQFMPLIHILVIGIVALLTLFLFNREINMELPKTGKGRMMIVLKIFAIAAIPSLAFMIGHWAIVFFIFFITPVLFLLFYQSSTNDKSIFKDISAINKIMATGYGIGLSLFFFLLLLSILFLFGILSGVSSLLIDIVSWNLPFDLDFKEEAVRMMVIYFMVFIYAFCFSLFTIGGGLLYHSLNELFYARGLMQKINKIGVQQKIRGLLKESSVHE